MDSSIIYRIILILLLLISPSYSIEFKGKFLQGHFILGTTDPNAKILVGKKKGESLKRWRFCFWN